MSNQSSTSSNQFSGNNDNNEMMNEGDLAVRNLRKIDVLLQQQQQLMKTIEGIKLIIQQFQQEIGQLVSTTLEGQMTHSALPSSSKSKKGRIRKEKKGKIPSYQKKQLTETRKITKEILHEREMRAPTSK